MRQALKCLLELEDDFRVVGETGDGREAVALAERLRPGVLIVEIAMPGLHGLEVVRQARQRSPQTAVIVLSRHDSEWHVTEALRNGAAGYVVKQAEASELITAVRTVARGRRFLSTPLSEDLVQSWLRRSRAAADPYERLTTREREVLQLVAEGYSSRNIATRLSISARTAEAHRANVMQKLRLRNQADLIRFALGRGFLPPAELSLPRRRARPRTGG